MSRILTGLFFSLILMGSAHAQTQPDEMTADIIPAIRGEQIVLDTVDAGTPDTEQWNHVIGQVWVRNVSQPSLYPVLPKNGRGNGQAVIVVPGGSYYFVSIESEGFWVAERLAAAGYTAFVLKYRPRETPEAPEDFVTFIQRDWQDLGQVDRPEHTPAYDDLAAAITLIRERASEWDLDPQSIGMIGFSAGALSAIRLIEDYPEAEHLDHVAMIYPPMMQSIIGGPRPDMFMAIAVDDPLFTQGGLSMVSDWLDESEDLEFHLYSGGFHGFGMRPQGTTSDLWIDQYLAWLALQ